MTTPMMRLLPHLPLLPMHQSLRILKAEGVPKAIIAGLLGVSRMQVVRWYSGASNPNSLSEEAVSALAYQVLRAKKLGRLNKSPVGLSKWAAAVAVNGPPFLHDLQPDELLTPETAHAAD